MKHISTYPVEKLKLEEVGKYVSRAPQLVQVIFNSPDSDVVRAVYSCSPILIMYCSPLVIFPGIKIVVIILFPDTDSERPLVTLHTTPQGN
jgi:hypothetical protein